MENSPVKPAVLFNCLHAASYIFDINIYLLTANHVNEARTLVTFRHYYNPAIVNCPIVRSRDIVDFNIII